MTGNVGKVKGSIFISSVDDGGGGNRPIRRGYNDVGNVVHQNLDLLSHSNVSDKVNAQIEETEGIISF